MVFLGSHQLQWCACTQNRIEGGDADWKLEASIGKPLHYRKSWPQEADYILDYELKDIKIL